MLQSLSKQRILAICIGASLLSHVICIFSVQRHSLWYGPPRLNTQKSFSDLAKEKTCSLALKESFGEDFLKPPVFANFSSVPEIEPLAVPKLNLPEIPFPSSSVAELPKDSGNWLLDGYEAPVRTCFEICLKSFPMPPMQRIDLLSHLYHASTSQQSLSFPSFCSDPLDSVASLGLEERAFLPVLPSAASPAWSVIEPLQLEASLPQRIFVSRECGAPALPVPPLPDFPTLEELDTSSYSDYFDAELAVSPIEEGEGYLFALTLIPRPDLDLPRIRPHYSFLIDRSNSIQKERLAAVKNAVLRAVKQCHLEDSFNIIAFDSKVDKLAPAPILATSSSLQAAKEFLQRVELGSFFSPANLYKPLVLTVPAQDDNLHAAILFTDGESLNKKTAQRDLALGWTAYNSGRVALYAIGIGEDPHLSALEAAAAFNRGKMYRSPTIRGIKRKLLKLLKSISDPIAMNLSIKTISLSSQNEITLFPPAYRLPHLYLNEPYVILGTVSSLDPFVLFVQGKFHTKYIHIKKTISLANAKPGGSALKSQWAEQRAYRLYEQYLFDLNPAHLADARALLAPHDLQVAFQ